MFDFWIKSNILICENYIILLETQFITVFYFTRFIFSSASKQGVVCKILDYFQADDGHNLNRDRSVSVAGNMKKEIWMMDFWRVAGKIYLL